MDYSVLRQKDRYQLSYDLSHKAYTSYVYPRQSSNGSTVIVYGHERGLRIIWYAGKNLKSPQKVSPPKTNGSAKTDPMVIDLSSDDGEDQSASVSPPEFEDEEEEIDPAKPYRGIIRQIDIPLGTAALRIAIPHIPKDIAQAPPDSWPPVFLDHILVAAACADSSLQIIIAPLLPPSLEVQDFTKLGIQTLKIVGPNSHQEFISDIAVTHTLDVERDDSENDTQARSRPQTRSQPNQNSTDTNAQKWSLLIASISSTGSGLLLVHQIPLIGQASLSPKPEHLLPLRRQFLRSSALGATMSFNPSPYPNDRHSTLLFTLPATSTVKLYQVFPTHTRERRGSTATSDSASTRASLRTSGPDKGRILATFLPPFLHNNSAILPRRKKCLDAQWIASGRAVLALLEDGEWGIWDVEAIGPNSSGTRSNLIQGQSNISGLQGGSITKFAIRSTIFPSEGKQAISSDGQAQPTSGSLALMTPSTRKIRSEGLFHGASHQDADQTTSQSPHGSICVDEQPTKNGRPLDESIIINYAREHIYIPSVSAFWKSDVKPIRLPAVKLGGQQPRRVGLLHDMDAKAQAGGAIFSSTSSSVPNFVVQTSHRLILSVHGLSDTTEQPSTSLKSGDALPLSFTKSTSDQVLLNSGDLDIDGMDRIITNMGTAGRRSKPLNLSANNTFINREAWTQEEPDEDVDMMANSPTPLHHSSRGFPTHTEGFSPQKRRSSRERNRLSHNRVRPTTERRVFT
ncbi:hypothetical protein LTR84_009380 [Exophiala bonariae]|uniref:BCAS3 domain-containing protein n=1 Tax=Exophiala bonariae TaxID=1690606 RepID=A0AAV9MX25_9EURO|nr:hypothetical protein LTR84_009380 [Exophiala bonariae]